MNFKSYSFTHPGHLRTLNEDSFYLNDEKNLWIVCDGMGGHEEGNFASRLITDIFENFTLEGTFENKIEMINKQIKIIHNLLINKVEKIGGNIIIGSTLMLLHIEDEKGVCIHAGDTRCYCLQNNTLRTITKDHAIQINDFYGSRRYLTSALSAPGNLFIETTRFTVCKNDVFLICTDGLYDYISNKVIKEAMSQDNIQEALFKLKLSVLATSAEDNITTVTIENK
ncbi:protein serine/threonine phosphatase [Arcobacter nitrofigilis DSM 7299]|uniref:Protein serine/threonine phosphatase n=1 Tax=Arcobacter nitrofigilis (strain ATCC 33309 / DSM 7299 / CCUG 15893 / LMG 7604 / NCTC 12251 / CI) TaxID=572480 RepID=D5V1H4_ARCNC|nr:PP2C family serine/threonine-protein phosphatase [Arcobacter nitrofigilis]ADG93408.1 protein serine/threonine phosphatase [Arcobacter nitrofigilis DSM 7299]